MGSNNKEGKKSGITNQILIAVVVALLAGGSSPWWWGEIFVSDSDKIKTDSGTNPVSLEPEPADELPRPTADKPIAKVWKKGNLTLPVSSGNFGKVADLDADKLLLLGTSIPTSDADIFVRQTVHGVVVEPGLSKGDGVSYDARFTAVNDSPVGRDGCADAAISPQASNHLQLSSDIDVGSSICMVTTRGRLAEFTITSVNLSGNPRQVQITFVVWNRE